MKHSVTVQIAGVRYALKTDEDDRWVKAVAALVDERFRDVQKKTRTPDTQAVAMLTALQIAEELFRERRDTGELRKKIRCTLDVVRTAHCFDLLSLLRYFHLAQVTKFSL